MKNNRINIPKLMETDRGKTPTIVSFLSGKGGVGKTTIAFNLGAALANSGQKTLLVDSDWHFGNLHILCNVAPEFTLADIMANPSFADQAIIPIYENLGLIASPSAGASEIEFNKRDYINWLSRIRALFAPYDFVLLDTPSGLVDLIALAGNASDINLLILNPELTAISDAYGLFKYLVKFNDDITAQLLINRVQNAGESDYIYQKFSVLTERFLDKVPFYAGYLPEDKKLIESIALQRPAFKIDDNCPSVESFLQLRGLLMKIRSGGLMPEEINNSGIINHSRTSADTKE